MNDLLAEKAIENNYFKELISKLEDKYFLSIFHRDVELDFSDKEVDDILRFADILASSSISFYKNTANRVVSLLHVFLKSDKYYAYFNDICIKLGLFLNVKNDEMNMLPNFLTKQYAIKNKIQKDDYLDIVYTDIQYDVVKLLNNSNHFSLSAPTSFGKTLIMMNQINRILNINKYANFCLLVPTNALLKEVTTELRGKFLNKKIRIINYPELRKSDYSSDNIIFVFTPERLNKYYALNERLKIDYLFVDEAQNMVKKNDVRTPLFYHVIELAAYHSANIFFISPYVSNPEVLLKLVNKNPNEIKVVEDRVVNQNKIIVDYSNKKYIYFDFLNRQKLSAFPFLDKDTTKEMRISHIIKTIPNGSGTIVYFGSKAKMIKSLLEMIKLHSYKNNKILDDFADEVSKNIHENYILVESIRKGIACHFGQLPKKIREKIEDLFKDGVIDILYSTSTLLQGVNLPASNIIVTSTKNGRTELSELDLSNLIGRAGRYGKSINGNVIFLNCSEDIKLNTISNAVNFELSSDVIDNSRRKNFYKDIGQLLINNKFVSSPSSLTGIKKRVIQEYSNIAILHNELEINSTLKRNIFSVNNNVDIFKKGKYSNYDNFDLFKEHITIPFVDQQKVFELESAIDIDLDNLKVEDLERLLYEAINIYGKSTLGDIQNRVGYYAKLVIDWIEGRPLNFIIKNSIVFFIKNPEKFRTYEYTYPGFDENNPIHLNTIINNTIEDIENKVKFSIKNAISNYIKIGIKRGNIHHTHNDFSDFIEFGSKNPTIIKLQKLGYSRELSFYLYKNHSKYMLISDEDIEIEYEKIYFEFDRSTYLYEEFEMIYTYEVN